MELNYIALFVADVEVSRQFYRDVLGFEFPQGIKNKSIEGKSGQIKIGLYHQDWYAELFDRPFVSKESSVIFAFTVEDLDRFYCHLLERSVNVVKPPTTMAWGQRLCFFTDPDNYLWEANLARPL